MISEIRTPAIIRMLEAGGMDFVIVDAEHGCYSYESIEALAAVAAGQKISCLVRIPEISRETVMKPIDAGCDGIVVPQVEYPEQVREVLEYAKYIPIGHRGVALRRGHSGYYAYPAAEYLEEANKKSMIIIQAESPGAVERIDDILSVDNIDVVFVGPFDLSVAMGIPGQLDHPELQASIRRVIGACRRHNVAAGLMQFQLESAKSWISEGIRFMVFSSDINMIVDQAAANVRALKTNI
jgi:2-keto-3-deoxy-L-rhamnonate aldolase RhmA